MKKHIIILSLFIASCAHEPTLLGTFHSDSPELAGSVDREAIRQVIRANMKSFQACYDEALKRNKDSYGKIELEWDVMDKGVVRNAQTVSSTLNDAQFDGCMEQAITKLTFPEPPATQVVRIKYPFVFSSTDAGNSRVPVFKPREDPSK
jgi:hypothetical protein